MSCASPFIAQLADLTPTRRLASRQSTTSSSTSGSFSQSTDWRVNQPPSPQPISPNGTVRARCVRTIATSAAQRRRRSSWAACDRPRASESVECVLRCRHRYIYICMYLDGMLCVCVRGMEGDNPIKVVLDVCAALRKQQGRTSDNTVVQSFYLFHLPSQLFARTRS